ncbi:MAG: BCCT family transporter [Alphaproteobacteria bacterium]|jgi:choline/glycine/proline betaine transport protein|nr:BCCT family transporter [Alphaproteobacteria bacterium]
MTAADTGAGSNGSDPNASGSNGPRKPRAAINGPVFFGSAILIFAFVVFGASAPELAGTVFSAVQSWITDTFGWFYVLAVAIFVVFSVALALSAYGQVRLGPDDSRPEFSNTAWFAMLFSAGMGIGLMFFGVAEPLMHFSSPAVGAGGTISAAREAMKTTLFHWGIHAWAIYAVIGLALAYFCFRHGLPLTIRSALYPLIGDRIHGPIGHAADIFAVLGTMFGVATSLGLGVLQINAGLSYVFGVPDSITVQLILIAIITLLATISVVAGLDAGIRRLSEINLYLALALVLFVLAVGPTLFLLQATVQNLGAYLSDLVTKTFTLYAYEPNVWIGGWTLFYWAWWIAWSPFVGMFIARVSRGRTIREFITGVLFVPVGFTAVWMTVFGNSAISLDLGVAVGSLTDAVDTDVATALFVFLEYFPLSGIVSVVATILVVTFFVTSSDSGSMVIDTITAGGDQDPPVWQRIFWATTEGLVAAVLLLTGGLAALQTAAIAAALPFTLVMLVVCWGLMRGLRVETLRRVSLDMPVTTQVAGAQVPWQKRLQTIIAHPDRRNAERFVGRVVQPALEDVAEEVRKTGLDAGVQANGREASLTVFHGEEREFLYAVKLSSYRMPTFAWAEPRRETEREERKYYRAEVHLLEGAQHYDVLGYTKEQVIADVLSQYEKHMHFLHLAR